MGAIASGGAIVLDDDVIRGLGIAPEVIQHMAEQQGRERLGREQAYREGRPPPDVAGRTVVLVDDGLATGASTRAAIKALRQHGQFDALIHIDETRAVEPLERTAGWERGGGPETYPFAV
jgi:predicted phosphoribosyltransferase